MAECLAGETPESHEFLREKPKLLVASTALKKLLSELNWVLTHINPHVLIQGYTPFPFMYFSFILSSTPPVPDMQYLFTDKESIKAKAYHTATSSNSM